MQLQVLLESFLRKLSGIILFLLKFSSSIVRQMVMNYKNILNCPQLRIVIDMDEFGFPAKEIDIHRSWISNQPVSLPPYSIPVVWSCIELILLIVLN
jgi:hypothetical protein